MILKKTIKLTNKNKKILVNLAINYGSKNEILQAFKKNKKKLNIKKISIFTPYPQKLNNQVVRETKIYDL